MKNYYRIMLGRKSAFAEECYKNNFIGADFGIHQDLTGALPDAWREFNAKFIPIYLESHPGKHKIAAGLACATLWTIATGIHEGDIILSPNGRGAYYVAEVLGEYRYVPGSVLPHQRSVRWLPVTIERSAMSEALRNSTGSIGTYGTITSYAAEIERFLEGHTGHTLTSTDETVEDPAVFAMEKHLEAFLVQNWKQTPLAKQYDIYEEDGEMIGQQYRTDDTGIIDILAISKDKKELLVVELKKGRASDAVIGQVQRYMGYVKEELAEEGQDVKGVIIALEDDKRIRRALSVAPNISFYLYKVRFELFKA
jgi:restriction system protein